MALLNPQAALVSRALIRACVQYSNLVLQQSMTSIKHPKGLTGLECTAMRTKINPSIRAQLLEERFCKQCFGSRFLGIITLSLSGIT